MNKWSLADIEKGLLPFRIARKAILRQLLGGLAHVGTINNPFILLSRLFVRVKSADSILEKLSRQRIQLDTLDALVDKVPDVLGARVIVETLDEMSAVDALLRRVFDVRSYSNHCDSPTEYGGRGADYVLEARGSGALYSFELQLRTILQHHWAACSFHLFHKKPRELADSHRHELLQLSELLAQAESPLAKLVKTATTQSSFDGESAIVRGLEDRVYLVAVEPGEQFAKMVTVFLNGDDRADHDQIVAAKLDLYAALPRAAIVEACCLGIQSFLLNEPHVRVPVSRIDQVVEDLTCSRIGNRA